MKAINAAKKVIKECKSVYPSNEDMRSDIISSVKRNLDEFGTMSSLEANAYNGYSIDQKFRIKSRIGTSSLHHVRYITDNDIENIVCSYELLDDIGQYMTTPSVGAVLSAVWDVHHALGK